MSSRYVPPPSVGGPTREIRMVYHNQHGGTRRLSYLLGGAGGRKACVPSWKRPTFASWGVSAWLLLPRSRRVTESRRHLTHERVPPSVRPKADNCRGLPHTYIQQVRASPSSAARVPTTQSRISARIFGSSQARCSTRIRMCTTPANADA